MSDSTFQSYRDLVVWNAGMTLAEECYRATRAFPREEIFGMVAQIRRSAASIPANIAEGHGRESTRSFIQFLRIAQGSTKELETHLLLAQRVDLLRPDQLSTLLVHTGEIGKMLRSLIRALQSRDAHA